MKKNIVNAMRVFSVYAVLAVSCVWADPSHMVRLKVPFDFTVCNHAMPAGDYEVTLNDSRTVALVRGEGKDAATFVLTHAAEASQVTEKPKLVFARYGDQYFLSEIWPAGTTEGHVLQKSRIEKELAQATRKPGIVALVVAGTGSHRPIR
jgi:hypothetical protein